MKNGWAIQIPETKKMKHFTCNCEYVPVAMFSEMCNVQPGTKDFEWQTELIISSEMPSRN